MPPMTRRSRSVSGDPFLGGDDFDRLLATHLVENGTWVVGQASQPDRSPPPETLQRLLDPATPEGAANFALLRDQFTTDTGARP